MSNELPETPEEEAGELEAPAEEEIKAPKDMTEEELENFLSGEEPAESESTVEGEEEEEETPPKEEPPAEEEEEEGDPEGDTKVSPETAELLAKIEALEKKTANQDKFFDRMGTEVGLLRKKTPEEDRAELEKIRDAYIEDPVEGHRLMEEFRSKQEHTTSLQNEYSANRTAEANREALSTRLPDMEKAEVIEELAAMMVEDGAPPQAVEVFKANPFYLDQATLFNLYQRRSLSKENVDLKTQLEAKDKEIAELKGKPGKLLEGIEKASGKSTLAGKPSGAAPAKTEKKVEKKTANLTGEELDALLNEK